MGTLREGVRTFMIIAC